MVANAARGILLLTSLRRCATLTFVDFLHFYLCVGILFLLGDMAMAAHRGVSLRDQMKASLWLSGDNPTGLLLSMLIYVIVWPIMIVIQSGGPPTRGA